jgi:hypothetical protein
VTEYLQGRLLRILILIKEQHEGLLSFRYSGNCFVDLRPDRDQIVARCCTIDFIQQSAQHFRAIIVVERKEESAATPLQRAFEMTHQGCLAQP